MYVGMCADIGEDACAVACAGILPPLYVGTRNMADPDAVRMCFGMCFEIRKRLRRAPSESSSRDGQQAHRHARARGGVGDASGRTTGPARARAEQDVGDLQLYRQLYIGSIGRRHVHCAGMGVPVLQK